MFMYSLEVKYIPNITIQRDEVSTAQGIYKQLVFRYLVDSLFLAGNFVSWYLLVYLPTLKLTVNKSFDNNISDNILCKAG